MLNDALENFYLKLTQGYDQAIDAEVPIDLIYGVVKAFEKQVTVDYERVLLNQVNQEFVEYTTHGVSEVH